MLILLTVLLFLTAWIPLNNPCPKCYLFLYICISASKQITNFKIIWLFTFFVTGYISILRDDIQVFIVMSNTHQAFENVQTASLRHIKETCSHPVLHTWGQTEMKYFMLLIESLYQVKQKDFNSQITTQWIIGFKGHRCTSHRPLIKSNNTHQVVSS